MAINSPKAITEGYIEASVGKAAAPASKLFVLGIGAGLLIGMGAVVSSTAAHGLDNAGMVRMVSGLLFPVGLIMVILMGTELFTGNALMVTAAIRGRITWGALLRNWAIVYVGNFVGAVALAATAVAAVEWPSDFDEKLAAHIAAEVSTNTTSSACEISIDTCYRTCDFFGFSAMRTPPEKPGMCIIIF